jgi:hypothetical protein
MLWGDPELSCPAQAGHPVNAGVIVMNENEIVITGSSAFADDDSNGLIGGEKTDG